MLRQIIAVDDRAEIVAVEQWPPGPADGARSRRDRG
jgi:hypothetical protein